MGLKEPFPNINMCIRSVVINHNQKAFDHSILPLQERIVLAQKIDD
jgi:hypothetical protein